jgi:uncharacterized protein YodC (DUF2158 family)
MAESKFKNGDRVKLKSGGPTMTVANASGEAIECSWFVEGHFQQGSFTPESLKSFQGKKVDATN